MAIPIIEWDEGNPPGNQAKSLGAERIREVKTQFRELFSVDHVMESSGSGTWGLHKKLTLYTQTAAVLPDANTGALFSKDVDGVCELFWADEKDNEIQLTSKGSWVGGFDNEIRMYSGLISAIPAGWDLCDGEDGRPNLFNKLLKGISTITTDPGTTGGTETFTLDSTNLPTHTHSFTVVPNSGHYHDYIFPNYESSAFRFAPDAIQGASTLNTLSTSSTGAHTHTISGGSSGAGAVISTYPAYCELAYIIKTED